MGGSKDCEIRKYDISVLRITMGPEYEVFFIEIVAVDFISDFLRQPEQSVAPFSCAHDVCELMTSSEGRKEVLRSSFQYLERML